MELKITKGKIPSAIKVVIYGAEGIGKSTFASQFPSPLYIDTEGSTKQLDVARLPNPSTWKELLEEVEYVINNPSVCKTLVIDTADWAEKLCIKYTCERLKVNNLEDIGFGKGYVYLEQDFKHLLTLLDQVIEEGINVVITAHALIRTFSQPGGLDSYDRYELKLQKKTTPLLKEWSDLLLFANYKTTVITDPKTNKKVGTGGERVMYTTHTPSWDAKNRFNLPDELPFEYKAIEGIFHEDKNTVVVEQGTTLDIEMPRGTIVESKPQDTGNGYVGELLNNLTTKGIDTSELLSWAKDTNNIQADDITQLDSEFIKFINQNIDKVYSKIVERRNPLGD